MWYDEIENRRKESEPMPTWVIEYVQSLTVGQVFTWLFSVSALLLGLVEWNKKIPFHPLTKVFSWIGSCLTKTLTKSFMDELGELKKQVENNNKAITDLHNEMDTKFKERERDNDEKEAKRLRANIIAFSDECGRDIHHTKVHFENIFRDIDDYNRYCTKHSLANHFIEGEVRYIQAVYDECVKEHKFTTGSDKDREDDE